MGGVVAVGGVCFGGLAAFGVGNIWGSLFGGVVALRSWSLFWGWSLLEGVTAFRVAAFRGQLLLVLG